MEREIYLKFHTHLAFVHLFPEVSHQFEQPTICYFKPESYHELGVITKSDPLTFMHVTYAQFLVARYILRVLTTGNLEHLCPEELFYNLLRYGSIDGSEQDVILQIWQFVDEGLGKLSDLSSLKWLNGHKRDMFPNKSTGFLAEAMKTGKLWNVSILLINLWVNQTQIFECNNVLYLSIITDAPLSWFVKMSEKIPFDNQHDLISVSVIKGNYEIAKYLIEKKCDKDIFDRIAEIKPSGGGILHSIIFRIALRYVLINPKIFVENTVALLRFVHKTNPKEFKRKDCRGRTFLHALPVIQKDNRALISSEHIFDIKKVLVNELNADVNELSSEGESILSLERDFTYLFQQETFYVPKNVIYRDSDSNFHLRNVAAYHDTLALLKTRNFAHINLKSKASGLTPLVEAVKYFGSIMEKSLELFRGMGANFNELDGEGNTILHYAIKNCDDSEFIKLLVKYGCKINVQNGGNLCALCLADKEEKVEIRKYFIEKLGLKDGQNCELNCIKVI